MRRPVRDYLYSATLFVLLLVLLAFYSPAGARRDAAPAPALSARFVLKNPRVSFEAVLARLQHLNDGIQQISLNPGNLEVVVRYSPSRVTRDQLAQALSGVMVPDPTAR